MKSSNERITAVVVAAGCGTRTGLSYNKLLYPVGSATVLEMTLDAFTGSRVQDFVVVASRADFDEIASLLASKENVTVVIGGDTRGESVYAGLKAIGDTDIVVIHDGARPFVTPETIDLSIESAENFGSGIVCVPVTDTVKAVANGTVTATLERATLRNAQTPQTFRYAEIVDAYNKVGTTLTDDSAVYERAGFTAHVVDGSYSNGKITTREDLLRLGADLRIGTGFDVHRLIENRKLILGGVEIPFALGLLGHSDADVLTHAIMDALLSAAGLPDIGVLFPDTDARFLDADSMILLKQVLGAIAENGFAVRNVSAVVLAEKPKLAAAIPNIRASLSRALGCDVNVSATTTEKLGIIGEGKGIAASAVCLLNKA